MNEKIKCRCGKGFASSVDGICKYCREYKYSRSVTKKMGVRNRGDGLSLEDEARYNGSRY